jgi:hypothetical protein
VGRTRRAVLEISIVDAVFEINGEVRVHPNADANATKARHLRGAVAVGDDCAKARSDVPRTEVLGLRRTDCAGTAQGKGDHGKQSITFHSESPFTWFFLGVRQTPCAARICNITPHHLSDACIALIKC